MVISAIWSILPGQNRGPYIRNPVYLMMRLHEETASGHVPRPLGLDAAAHGLSGDAGERGHDPLGPRPRVTGQPKRLAVVTCGSSRDDRLVFVGVGQYE